MQLEKLLARQKRSWEDDEPLSIENLLSESPVVEEQSEAIVDLIYAEILLREQRGEHPSKEEYVSRFPELSDSIEKQFQVHRALKIADEADILTDAGGNTLPHDAKDTTAFAFTPPAVPGFELEELLGRGGSGVAWRARDIKLDRTVAIKFLLDNDSKVEWHEQDERLSREATAAAKLLHPSIVQVFQIGESAGVPFLVMEYVEGGSLAQKLRSGPMTIENSVELATSISDAIEHAHGKGIIHRDIKPGNILLGSDGVPQVCDFGLARKLDAEYSLHKTGDVLGTPAYMPPEQARGEEADERSDVYSIGAVLYESLCGRTPFQAAHPWEILYQVTTIDPLPLRQLNPVIPVELETISQKCLEKNPQRRYQTAAALKDDLRRYAAGLPIEARPLSLLNKLSKWCLRNKAVAVLAATTFLLLTTLAIGSTIAAFQLSASNKKVLEEQRLAIEAQEKAVNDRTVAVESLYELINAVYDELVSESIPLEAREEIALAAIVGLRKITEIDGDALSTKTAILAKQRIGEIQAQRGQSDLAAVEFEEALRMAREFFEADPSDLDRKKQLARVINFLLMHRNRTGATAEAQQLSIESNLILDELLLEEPDNVEILKRWVVARSYEMDRLWQTKPPQETIDLGLECVANVERLYQHAQDDAEKLRTINQFYFRLGRSYLNASNLAESEKWFTRANEVIAEAIEKFPKKTHLLSTSVVTNKLYGSLLNAQGRFLEARAAFDKAVEDAAFIASLDPKNLYARAEVANARVMRSATLTAMGEHDQAIKDLEFGAIVYEEKLALAPGEASALRTLLQISYQMLDPLNRMYRFDETRVAAERVIEIVEMDAISKSMLPGDEFLKWYAEINIGAIDAFDGKVWDNPTPEDRAFGLFLAAFVFSDRDSSDQLDAKSLDLIESMEPDASFTTVSGLFEYMRAMSLTNPVVLQLLPMFEARMYARQAQLLDRSAETNEENKLRIEELKKQAVDLLVPLSKLSPTMINQIYLEPDLGWLRSTDTFAEAGLLLEGAD